MQNENRVYSKTRLIEEGIRELQRAVASIRETKQWVVRVTMTKTVMSFYCFKRKNKPYPTIFSDTKNKYFQLNGENWSVQGEKTPWNLYFFNIKKLELKKYKKPISYLNLLSIAVRKIDIKTQSSLHSLNIEIQNFLSHSFFDN